MTISSTTTAVSYTGNGSTTAFPVTFAFFGTGTSSEIEVIERARRQPKLIQRTTLLLEAMDQRVQLQQVLLQQIQYSGTSAGRLRKLKALTM